MCRLSAYVGVRAPVGRFVFDGAHALATQSWAARELLSGSVNADGFGVVWRPEGRDELVRLARTEPIWHDPDLPGLLGAMETEASLAALRNATPGLPVSPTGLLPFVQGCWAGALNGFVPGFRPRHMSALREGLDDAHYALLKGSSDAETLFLLVLQELEGGVAPASGLRSLVDRVAPRLAPGEWAPLTLAVLGPAGLTVLHTALEGPARGGRVNSLYLSSTWSPGGTVVASEPLDPSGDWEPVPHHSILHVTPEGTPSVQAL